MLNDVILVIKSSWSSTATNVDDGKEKNTSRHRGRGGRARVTNYGSRPGTTEATSIIYGIPSARGGVTGRS